MSRRTTLLCTYVQEILQILQIIPRAGRKMFSGVQTVRRWYGFQNFTPKARFWDKIMKSLPLSVAQVPLPKHFSVCPIEIELDLIDLSPIGVGDKKTVNSKR